MCRTLAILLNIALLGSCIEVETKANPSYGDNATMAVPLFYDGTNVYAKIGVGTPTQESGDTFVYLSSWLSNLIVITLDAGMCGKPFYDYEKSQTFDIVERDATLEILQLPSWRNDNNYEGMQVKDTVCLGEGSDLCVDQFEFFAQTTNSACKNMFGVQPSLGSGTPNLIEGLFLAGKINANKMTMYLDWAETESMLDLGISNSEYIYGNWSNHNITFTNSASPSKAVSFELDSFKFNGTEYLTAPATLVPINESPYTIVFGTDFQAEYENFASAFLAATRDHGWWCDTTDLGKSCQASNIECSKFLGDNALVTIPTLEIQFDGQNYTMPAESLLSQEYQYCELNIGLDNGSLPSDWMIVGQTFFKDFVLSIDYDNNLFSIGLSKNAH